MSNVRTPPADLALQEASTVDLVREAIDESKELLRLEIEMMKSEVGRQIEQAKKAAIALGIALAASVLVVCMLGVAVVLALGATALVAILVAAAFLVIGGAAALAGYALLPKKPLEQTRQRIESESRTLKEHIA